MSRFETLFKTHTSPIFMPFFVLGYPTKEACLQVITDFIEGGAKALELGIAFSDPIADGPILQEAQSEVLQSGFTTQDAFELLAAIRQRLPTIPISILTYAQTLEAIGIECFFKKLHQLDIDALLLADVPLFESTPYQAFAKQYDIDWVCLAAPSTPNATLEIMAKMGSGYTYVVTRNGVTGVGSNLLNENLKSQLETLKAFGAPPAVLGFGIKGKEDLEAIQALGASGYIIGSKLIEYLSGRKERQIDQEMTKIPTNMFVS